MAAQITQANDKTIIWITSEMDLSGVKEDMVAQNKEERIVTILGMGLLDRQELSDVLLDSCSLELEGDDDDDDSSSAESDCNDSLELAKRRVRSERMGGRRGSVSGTAESQFSLVKQPSSPVEVAVKDTLEHQYSSVMWKVVDDAVVDIPNVSSSQKPRVATNGGFSQYRPITYRSCAA